MKICEANDVDRKIRGTARMELVLAEYFAYHPRKFKPPGEQAGER